MKLIVTLAAALLVAGLLGCGSSPEAERDWSEPDTTISTPRPSTFETRTDTVTSQQASRRFESPTDTGRGNIRFTVQIGAFRDAKHAAAVQNLARQRYDLPVVNDYNAQRRLYQVRIGFFETEEEASAFRTKLLGDFKNDYADAWTVQINK